MAHPLPGDGHVGGRERALHGQRILLVSPQSWDHIAISKHHYARELARRGNHVFFLEPPVEGLGSRVKVQPLEDAPGVSLVRYSLGLPGWLRFRLRWLFDRLMRRRIARIVDAIHGAPDIVWCFDLNLFSDLNAFRAPVKIFHPVDAVANAQQIRTARSADVVFSVSDVVLEKVRKHGIAAHFVNHGLAEQFATLAAHSPDERGVPAARPRVGYVGNLLHPSLDRGAMEACIRALPEAEFHFWGPADASTSSPAQQVFIATLRSAPNVTLHGATSSDDLARAIQAMDAFLLAYATDRLLYDASNSHKILEYLSTGRVVVSSMVSAYAGRADLLVMPAERSNDSLPRLLGEVLADLPTYNARERMAERRRFALAHTYAKQVERIIQHLPVKPGGVR